MSRAFCFAICLLAVLLPVKGWNQTGDFDLEEYRSFLDDNRKLTADELHSRFPLANPYQHQIDFDPATAVYLDSIALKYQLTEDELALIRQHGFMVTERLGLSFGKLFLDIYQRDLPVFVSTDAILFALHQSYDNLLKSLEHTVIIPKLRQALQQLHQAMPEIDSQFGAMPQMQPSLDDIDVYISVARSLLTGATVAPLRDNAGTVSEILALIETGKPECYPLFNEECRMLDFSQFKPRGHYTDTEILKNYFKAMMWLGRTEFRLTPPVEPGGPPPPNVTREIIDAYLILQIAETSGALQLLNDINELLEFLVGESDNVTFGNLQFLAREINLTSAAQFLEPDLKQLFQETLRTHAFSFQRINSQILFTDPMSPEQIQPPSAFLPMGQRFLIDSFVMGNVVFDKISYNGEKVFRNCHPAWMFSLLWAMTPLCLSCLKSCKPTSMLPILMLYVISWIVMRKHSGAVP